MKSIPTCFKPTQRNCNEIFQSLGETTSGLREKENLHFPKLLLLLLQGENIVQVFPIPKSYKLAGQMLVEVQHLITYREVNLTSSHYVI